MSDRRIRFTEKDVRRLASQGYDARKRALPESTNMSEEGWYQSGFLDGYAEATKDVRKAKELSALANIQKQFPMSCAENFKVEEDFKCRAKTCILNKIPETAQMIQKEGCECFFAKEVIAILRERGDERVYKITAERDKETGETGEGKGT
jgi:hypothetical protein